MLFSTFPGCSFAFSYHTNNTVETFQKVSVFAVVVSSFLGRQALNLLHGSLFCTATCVRPSAVRKFVTNSARLCFYRLLYPKSKDFFLPLSFPNCENTCIRFLYQIRPNPFNHHPPLSNTFAPFFPVKHINFGFFFCHTYSTPKTPCFCCGKLFFPQSHHLLTFFFCCSSEYLLNPPPTP